MRVLRVSSRVAAAGLLGLVAIDVVLVATALHSSQASGIDTSPVSSASISTDVSVSPSTTPSTSLVRSSTTRPKTGSAAVVAPLRIMLAAVNNRLAWRVHVGSCSGGGATLARTTDGGKTWVDTKAPLRTIVRLRATGSRSAFVIGVDVGARCTARLKTTTDGGGNWGAANNVGSVWFRDPKKPDLLGAPGSSGSRPCRAQAVVDLAVVSADTARVLCTDGRVRSTTNTGASWTDSGRVRGAVAVAVSHSKPVRTYVVRLNAPDCAGVQVRRIDQSAAISCIVTSVPRAPGQIALSLFDRGGWLAVGNKTMRSTDGLATWRVP